jgi:hypothetical protein
MTIECPVKMHHQMKNTAQDLRPDGAKIEETKTPPPVIGWNGRFETNFFDRLVIYPPFEATPTFPESGASDLFVQDEPTAFTVSKTAILNSN